MVFLPLFVTMKIFQFLLVEILFLDPVGHLYKVKGSEEGFTIARYARMCKDLDKPQLFRQSSFWQFTIYPFMLSTELACNSELWLAMFILLVPTRDLEYLPFFSVIHMSLSVMASLVHILRTTTMLRYFRVMIVYTGTLHMHYSRAVACLQYIADYGIIMQVVWLR